MLEFAIKCSKKAGEILLKHWKKSPNKITKKDRSNIVTQADIKSERQIVNLIKSKFPDHGIISEEYGVINIHSDKIWIIDPLDGTSNFAAGLEWFGVLIALIVKTRPVLAVAYLPAMGKLYYAEAGEGAFKNNRKIRVAPDNRLENVLCSIGIDFANQRKLNRQLNILIRLCSRVRNIRSTNSLVDFCNVAEGFYGGAINFNTKIWDISAPYLIIKEAGGKMTEINGQDIQFNFARNTKSILTREYRVIASNKNLHNQLIKICK